MIHPASGTACAEGSCMMPCSYCPCPNAWDARHACCSRQALDRHPGFPAVQERGARADLQVSLRGGRKAKLGPPGGNGLSAGRSSGMVQSDAGAWAATCKHKSLGSDLGRWIKEVKESHTLCSDVGGPQCCMFLCCLMTQSTLAALQTQSTARIAPLAEARSRHVCTHGSKSAQL